MSMNTQGTRSASLLSRRELLGRYGTGMGLIGLAGLLADQSTQAAEPAAQDPLSPRKPHFRPRAKRIIHLYMNGGPSQVDTFDPKPALEKYHGKKAPASVKIERNSTDLMRSPF